MRNTPSIQQLEIAIDNYLTNHPELSGRIRLVNSHPGSKEELRTDTHVVLEYLSDRYEGRIVTKSLIFPSFNFCVYARSYTLVRKYQELLIEVWHSYNQGGLVMLDQFCENVVLVNRTGISFDAKLNLYYCNIVIKFNTVLKEYNLPG
jgi:hypothetical protein